MKKIGDVLRRNFSQPATNNRPNHQPNHLVEKTVAAEFKRYQLSGFAHSCRMNCPDGVHFRFAAVRSKSGKIMRADKLLRRASDFLNIKRSVDVPDARHFEWWQNRPSPKSVAIDFSFRGKPCMKIRRNIAATQHANGRRQ